MLHIYKCRTNTPARILPMMLSSLTGVVTDASILYTEIASSPPFVKNSNSDIAPGKCCQNTKTIFWK